MNDTLVDTLQVSDLALQIEGPAEWIRLLRRIWRGWMGSEAQEPWAVSMIRSSPPFTTLAPAPPRIHFVDGVCHFSSPGYSGTIDRSRATARVEVQPMANRADLAIFMRTCLALQAFDRGGLLFHSAGVVHRGHGYALFGLSGSGKSTAARLSGDDIVLNDDLILIKPDEAGWQVWGTPFGGGWSPLGHPVPLRTLLRLVQDRRDSLRELGPGVALGELVASSPVVNADTARLPALLTRWLAVLDQVPLRALHFRKDPTFWEVIDAEFG
ncbi:hypothetical protein ACFLYD_05215 [Chloroflexota bacterium]